MSQFAPPKYVLIGPNPGGAPPRGERRKLPLLSTGRGPVLANVEICAFLVRVGAPFEAGVGICLILIRSGRPLPVNVGNYQILYRPTVKGGKEGSLKRARGPDRAADRPIQNECENKIAVENRSDFTAPECKLWRFQILWKN